jgi:hypothetical protein
MTRRLRGPTFALTCACALLLPACVGFEQLHYVHQRHPEEGRSEFYRVRVQGRTLFSLTSYKSGWYPTEIVSEMFGSLPTRRETERDDRLTSHAFEPDRPCKCSDGGSSLTVFDENLCQIDPCQNTFVTFLHADADFLAQQLTQLAEDRELADDVVALLTAREAETVAEKEAEARVLGTRLDALSLPASFAEDLKQLRTETDAGKRSELIARLRKALAERLDELSLRAGVEGPELALDASDRAKADAWWQKVRDDIVRWAR